MPQGMPVPPKRYLSTAWEVLWYLLGGIWATFLFVCSDTSHNCMAEI